jgi:hypothetical protein
MAGSTIADESDRGALAWSRAGRFAQAGKNFAIDCRNEGRPFVLDMAAMGTST